MANEAMFNKWLASLEDDVALTHCGEIKQHAPHGYWTFYAVGINSEMLYCIGTPNFGESVE